MTGYISKVYKNLADEPLNAGITNIGQASVNLILEGRVPYVRRLTAYSGEEEHAKPLSEGHYIAVDLLADVNSNDGSITHWGYGYEDEGLKTIEEELGNCKVSKTMNLAEDNDATEIFWISGTQPLEIEVYFGGEGFDTGFDQGACGNGTVNDLETVRDAAAQTKTVTIDPTKLSCQSREEAANAKIKWLSDQFTKKVAALPDPSDITEALPPELGDILADADEDWMILEDIAEWDWESGDLYSKEEVAAAKQAIKDLAEVKKKFDDVMDVIRDLFPPEEIPEDRVKWLSDQFTKKVAALPDPSDITEDLPPELGDILADADEDWMALEEMAEWDWESGDLYSKEEVEAAKQAIKDLAEVKKKFDDVIEVLRDLFPPEDLPEDRVERMSFLFKRAVDALPDPSDITLEDENTLFDAEAYWLELVAISESYVEEGYTEEQIAAAKKAIKDLEAEKKKFDEAMAAYEELLVKPDAKKTIAAIKAIPESIQVKDKAAIQAARAAYDAIKTAEEKAEVENYKDLEDAEAVLKVVEKIEKADAVTQVNYDSSAIKRQIADLRAAIEELGVLKSRIGNYSKYTVMVNTAADYTQRVSEVNNLLSALSKITEVKADQAEIDKVQVQLDEAQAKYNALGVILQGRITGADAMNKVQALVDAAAEKLKNQKHADWIIAKIKAIPTSVTIHDMAAVKAAELAYAGAITPDGEAVKAAGAKALDARVQALVDAAVGAGAVAGKVTALKTVLQTAEAEDIVAAYVKSCVDVLPANPTAKDRNAVEIAKALQKALTDKTDKANLLVAEAQADKIAADHTYKAAKEKLEAAEVFVNSAEQIIRAADEIIAAIKNLPAADKLTMADKEKVEAVAKQYADAPQEVKDLVDADKDKAAQKLKDAVAKISRLTAEDVESKISALKELTGTEDKAAIDEAAAALKAVKDAYNALTDSQKALVDNVNKLDSAAAGISAAKVAYTDAQIKEAVKISLDTITAEQAAELETVNSLINNWLTEAEAAKLEAKNAEAFKSLYSGYIKTAKNLEKAAVTGITAKTYTGKSLTQKPVVKVSGKTLKSGTDYTVSYKNNKSVGTAAVTMKGKGDYIGAITKTFIIKPAKGSITSLKKGTKRFTVKYKKQSGARYQIYYKKAGSKARTVKTGIAVKTVKNLKKGKTYTVKVRAYKKIGSKTYYGAYSKAKKVRVR